MHFGQTKVWVEDDWKAARSFCLLCLSSVASLPRTYDRLFSLMSANCLGLRPPAAMTDGWFPPVQAISSAGLCNDFLEHHAFLSVPPDLFSFLLKKKNLRNNSSAALGPQIQNTSNHRRLTPCLLFRSCYAGVLRFSSLHRDITAQVTIIV